MIYLHSTGLQHTRTSRASPGEKGTAENRQSRPGVGGDSHDRDRGGCAQALVDGLGKAAATQRWQAASLGEERLWAVEDCRHVTGALERMLDRPRAGEDWLRELKLLVVHRDDLVDERRRCQQRLRWHLHQLDPSLSVPAGALDRQTHLARVSRWLARRERSVQVGIARDLVPRCRTLGRAIAELERDLAARAVEIAPALLELPGCGGLTAAKLFCEIGPIDRFQTDAQLARHGGVAPLEASSGGRTRRHRLDRGGNRQLNCALHRIAITQSTRASTRAHLPRTQAERRQKPPRTIRCLKRQLVRIVFTTLKTSPTLT
jgi:transposase